MKRTADFTSGNIIKQLIWFSIPIILGELFQNLYSSVDTLVVGSFVGKNALAAVSICASLSNLLVGFFNGMSVGTSVVVARAFGRSDQEGVNTSARVSFTFSTILGVALSIVGILLAPYLLQLTGTKGEIYNDALTYLEIYLIGLMFTVIYNTGAGILRAIGDSVTPFNILVVTCILNVILDLLLVAVMENGVAGVAIATVIANGVSVFLVYRKLSRVIPWFRLILHELKPNKDIIYEVVNIGVPSGLQGSLISISNLFVWRYINGFAAAAVPAGIGVAQRLDKFISLPCKAFGLTITTFVSQNAGAGNYDRNKKAVVQCTALSLGTAMVLGFIVYSLAETCVAMFNADPDVIAIGVSMMRTIIPLYFLMAIRQVFLGVLRGYGNTRIPMILSLIGMVVVRQIFLAISMRINHSVVNIYYCYPIAWGASMVLLVMYYLKVKDKLVGGT